MNAPVEQSSFFSHPLIQAMDYLPIASTLTNAMMMIHKTLSEKPHEPQALSSHTFRPLVRQSGSSRL